MPTQPFIGTLNEGSLHAALKHHYSLPGDRFEVPLGNFVIDVVRDFGEPDELLLEIQTGSFGAMGNKLDALLEEHRMLLIHPIAVTSTLERRDTKPRKSPKKGSIYSLFSELVSIPTLLDHPNLTLDIVLVDVIKKQEFDPKLRRRRGGYRTVDRHLQRIVDTYHFEQVDDLLSLLPDALQETFTTADIASNGKISRSDAQKLAYCFREAGLIDEIQRTRAGVEYRLHR